MLPDKTLEIISPKNSNERGCQLSLRFMKNPHEIQKSLELNGIITDFREPDVIRVAPVPLYNSFEDVFKFVEFIAGSEHV